MTAEPLSLESMAELERQMESYEIMFAQMKDALIRDVSETVFKSERKNLLDAFFSTLEAKAEEVQSSKTYREAKAVQETLGTFSKPEEKPAPIQERPSIGGLRESPQKQFGDNSSNSHSNQKAKQLKGFKKGEQPRASGKVHQSEEDKENYSEKASSGLGGRALNPFKEIQNATDLSPEKRMMNRDRDAIGLSHAAQQNSSNAKHKRGRAGRDLKTPDKTNLENESPTKKHMQ